MDRVLLCVIEWITGATPLPAAEVRRVAGPGRTESEVAVLAAVLEGTRLSHPTVVDREATGPDGLTRVTVRSARGVGAELYITTTDAGTLDGFRIVASAAAARSARELRERLTQLDSSAAVTVHRQSDGVARVVYDTDRVRAVASLAKVFVILTLLDAVVERRLDLTERHILRAADLAPASAGLSAAHIGASLTLAELATLAALRSDNTASDILTARLGIESVRRTAMSCGVPAALAHDIRTAGEIWSGLGTAADPATVAHLAGDDYFLPLRAVTTAMHRIVERPWSPWPPTGSAGLAWDAVRFKGGSAPGVLAGVWHVSRESDSAAMAFAVNDDTSFGTIEEIHAFTAAESWLRTLTVEDPQTPMPTRRSVHAY